MIPSGYKASKVYSVLPTDGAGDLTFSRAGALPSFNATRVNSDGLIEEVLSNVPRLDYSDGGCPSLLIEPQSTNLLLRSEEFNDAYWTKTNTTITTNSIISPDGNLTADKLVENTSNSSHTVHNASVSIIASTDYTFTCFAKKDERDSISFQIFFFGSNTGYNVIVNLNDGSFTTIDTGDLTSLNKRAEVVYFSNGWYKITVGLKTSITSTFARITTSIRSGGSSTYLGDGTSGLYLWGAQLEALPYATSYIPTVASTVTRVAETVSKLNLNSLPNAYPFTVFVEPIFRIDNSFAFSFLNSASIQTYFTVRINGNKIQVLTRDSVEIITQSLSNFNLNQFYKIAVVFSSSEIKLYVNGVLEATSVNTISFNPLINDLLLGQLRTVSDTGTRTSLKSLQVYPTALSDVELIALTTL
jgi:hypothetical protein